jgi:hypothetical protein
MKLLRLTAHCAPLQIHGLEINLWLPWVLEYSLEYVSTYSSSSYGSFSCFSSSPSTAIPPYLELETLEYYRVLYSCTTYQDTKSRKYLSPDTREVRIHLYTEVRYGTRDSYAVRGREIRCFFLIHRIIKYTFESVLDSGP